MTPFPLSSTVSNPVNEHPSAQKEDAHEKNLQVVTLGCRLNAVDSEVIRRNWLQETKSQQSHTHPSTVPTQASTTVVINSCAVTKAAISDARKAVRQARRAHPDARIVVTGCGAQVEPDTFAAMPEVDAVVGNSHKYSSSLFKAFKPNATLNHANLDGIVGNTEDNRSQRVLINDPLTIKEQALHMMEEQSFHLQPQVPQGSQVQAPSTQAGEFRHRTRAFVAIQNGCDHVCTFCIIPRARGPSWSVPPRLVLQHVGALLDQGFEEIVITGVDLTSYAYTDTHRHHNLADLVDVLCREFGNRLRLRLSSVDCIEIPDRLVSMFGTHPQLLPHVHLSLQSGDDMILKRMRRRHSAAQAVDLCRALRQVRPDIVLGADFIVGFPTETATMFANTVQHVEDCGLALLHVFSYSERPQTAAAKIPRKVPDSEKKSRSEILRRLGDHQRQHALDRWVGQTVQALLEQHAPADTTHQRPYWTGYTDHFLPILVCGDLPYTDAPDNHDNHGDGLTALTALPHTFKTPQESRAAGLSQIYQCFIERHDGYRLHARIA